MTYRIHADQSVEANLREIARDQIEKAISEIENSELDRHETVHQVRKRCKKIRGLIRLVRPQFQDYQSENKFFRDQAKQLSYIRDAQSMIECLDDLLEYYEQPVDPSAFEFLRDELLKRRQKIADDQVELDRILDDFRGQMRMALERAGRWTIDRDGFAAVEGGVRKTYARGRKALATATEKPTAENFHELRKRVKYHWYHTRLLREIWPRMMRTERQAGDELSDLLGDEHDLAVFRQMLVTENELVTKPTDRQTLFGLIDQRRTSLQTQAIRLSRYLFAEKSKQLIYRYRSYWKTWEDAAS